MHIYFARHGVLSAATTNDSAPREAARRLRLPSGCAQGCG